MERTYGVHLTAGHIVLDIDVIGLAVNPYRSEEVLKRFYERHSTTTNLPIYTSKAVHEDSVRLLLGKTFIDVNLEE